VVDGSIDAMTDLVVINGSTFFVSYPVGDSDGRMTEGLFHDDVRHLSRWRLLVDGSPLRLLTSRLSAHHTAHIFGTLPRAQIGDNPALSIRRDRRVAGGMHEDLVVTNNSELPAEIVLDLEISADFADLFEVKDGTVAADRGTVTVGDRRLTFSAEQPGFRRATVVDFDEGHGCLTLDSGGARFDVRLEPRATWQCCVSVTVVVDGQERPPLVDCSGVGMTGTVATVYADWLAEAPVVTSSADAIGYTYRQSLTDLAALCFRPWPDVDWVVPAAGQPWFMALFGRDSLIASYQALPFMPGLAAGTLRALARLQATADDPYRDAEPGKIPHELRRGRLATLGEMPFDPYYGTHDATPLFLVLLDEYERWTGDQDLVRELEAAARRAVHWMEHGGDPDGDGYLEWHCRSAKGLANQSWRDSHDSMAFADGRLAVAPIASSEIQGYAYDARRRTARLARTVWGDDALADRLDRDAAALRTRFNTDFWCADRGHFALALDGEKNRVDAMTSNVGHLLWSGIVDDEHAKQSADRLMAPDMWSGWGVRTMGADEAAYNPIGYHIGTVWPHDSGLVAEGLRRYGFRESASTIAFAVVESAAEFGYRLPEVFAGFARSDTIMPVEYPTASRPQAWSAGAALLALRTMLGLDVTEGRLRSAPCLPDGVSSLAVRGLRVHGRRVEIGEAPG